MIDIKIENRKTKLANSEVPMAKIRDEKLYAQTKNFFSLHTKLTSTLALITYAENSARQKSCIKLFFLSFFHKL